MMIGYSSHVFAISLEWILSEQYNALKGVQDMFDSKWKVSNIYGSALKLMKDNEVKTTFESIDQVMVMHPEFRLCNVNKTDVLNILYDANLSFRAALEQTVLKKSKKNITLPDPNDILKSYKKIIMCRHTETKLIVTDLYENVRNTLNYNYNGVVNNVHKMATVTQVNFGEDLYINWTLDDSDYDLMIDIDKIWKKLFDSFTSPPVLQSYQIPSLGAGGWSSNLLVWPPWAWWWSSPGPSSLFTVGVIPPVSTPGAGNRESIKSKVESQKSDKDVDDFLNDTNSPSGTSNSSVQWNQCISTWWVEAWGDDDWWDWGWWWDGDPEPEPPFVAPPFVDRIPPFPPLGSWNTSWTMSPAVFDQLLANAIEFMASGWSGQAESCLKKCKTDYPNILWDQYLFCQAQCLCFKVSWPTWEPWISRTMDDMYRVTFCTIPVENTPVRWGKKLNTIEAIVRELRNIFAALLNGGEIFKRVPTREFFDSAFKDMKFGEIFSYQVTFGFKPLFANKSESLVKTEQKQQLDTLENGIFWTDDRNQYIVIADIAKNKVEDEYVNTLKEWNQKITDTQEIANRSQSSLPDTLRTAWNQKVAQWSEIILDFVNKNIDFWNATLLNMNEMAGLAGILKKKIDDSK